MVEFDDKFYAIADDDNSGTEKVLYAWGREYPVYPDAYTVEVVKDDAGNSIEDVFTVHKYNDDLYMCINDPENPS